MSYKSSNPSSANAIITELLFSVAVPLVAMAAMEPIAPKSGPTWATTPKLREKTPGGRPGPRRYRDTPAYALCDAVETDLTARIKMPMSKIARNRSWKPRISPRATLKNPLQVVTTAFALLVTCEQTGFHRLNSGHHNFDTVPLGMSFVTHFG
ncbi:exported protein of unknown function [Cupriavidus taiwanensis]|nr:exported protein of unknown function [Cupriavidus taiwanensis]